MRVSIGRPGPSRTANLGPTDYATVSWFQGWLRGMMPGTEVPIEYILHLVGARRALGTQLPAFFHIFGSPAQTRHVERLIAMLRAAVVLDGDDMAGALIRKTEEHVIGVNLNDTPQRQRFTIAHEIGHLLLHDEELHVDERMMLFRDRDSTTARDATEVEANQFASNLLMPAFMLQKDVDDADFLDIDETAEKLAKRYNVSVPAMTLRLARFLKYGL